MSGAPPKAAPILRNPGRCVPRSALVQKELYADDAVSIDQVHNGKIIKEQFFYDMS